MLSFKEKMGFYLAKLYEDAKDNTCMYFISPNLIFSGISSNLCENFVELPPLSAEETQGQEQKQSFQIPQRHPDYQTSC